MPIVLEGLAMDPPQEFVLRPGDLVGLTTISAHPLAVDNLRVEATGKLSVPFFGAVTVSGLSLHDASREVEKSMRLRERFAQAALTLTAAEGHRATVIGAINTPGVYVLNPNTRVADIVAQAGGLMMESGETRVELVDMADAEASRLVRDGEALPISVAQALLGVPQHNVRVYPSDLLYVPPMRNKMVWVLGSVNAAGQFPWREGMTLASALALAGGTAQNASNTDIRVLRGPLSKPRVYRASLRALFAGEAHNVLLERGDIVFVTEDTFYTITDVLTRLSPLLTAGALATTVIQTANP